VLAAIAIACGAHEPSEGESTSTGRAAQALKSCPAVVLDASAVNGSVTGTSRDYPAPDISFTFPSAIPSVSGDASNYIATFSYRGAGGALGTHGAQCQYNGSASGFSLLACLPFGTSTFDNPTAGTTQSGNHFELTLAEKVPGGSNAVATHLTLGVATYDDADPCVQGACNPTGGVLLSNSAAGTQCAYDATVCRGASVCNGSGACVAGAAKPSGTSCATGQVDSCAGAQTCDGAGSCVQGSPAPAGTSCGTGACGAASCNGTGSCILSGTGPNPDDGNPCTTDTCDPNLGIQNTLIAGCGVPPGVTPIDRTVTQSCGDDIAFLYSGASPTQTGAAAGAIDATRSSLVRGRVLNDAHSGMSGITVTVSDHPEYGATMTRSDGWFDLAVNGGAQFTLKYASSNYRTVYRNVPTTPCQGSTVKDIIVTTLDPNANAIATNAATYQVARGSAITTSQDPDGARQATLLIPSGTNPTNWSPSNGQMTIRATEYTVGANGPQKMPADLPPLSGYTYAVDLSIDEAEAAGVASVTFNQAMPFYLDNFLGIPTGETVPIGHYDPSVKAWVADPNGRVVNILSTTGGIAHLDVNGNGVEATAAEYANLGITTDEQTALAITYPTAPKSLWRAPITHFTNYDTNWGIGPPNGAGPPNGPPPNPPKPPRPHHCAGGSIIECENQILGEQIPIAGTPYSLRYESDRTAAASRVRALDIPLTGTTAAPSVLKRIDVDVSVAGRSWHFTSSSPAANQTYHWTWDGTDAYGRLTQGDQTAKVALSWVYQGEIFSTPGFAKPPTSTISGVTANRSTREFFYTKTSTHIIGTFDAKPLGFGGWMLDAHAALDPLTGTLYQGNGERHYGDDYPLIAQTVVGSAATAAGDGGPATSAGLSGGNAIAFGPDGSLFLVDGISIRRVGRDGIIHSIAGNAGTWGMPFTDGADASTVGINTQSYGGLVAGPDGSLYAADRASNRIIKLVPGTPWRAYLFAGSRLGSNGSAGSSGDEGPATSALLNSPMGIALGPEGNLYIADSYNHRIRYVTPDGIIHRLAGRDSISTCGSNNSGNEGAALAACIVYPQGVGVDPLNGEIYVSSGSGNSVRRIGRDGIIHAFAGNGSQAYYGDGGLATSAALKSPLGIAFGPDGGVYIGDYNGVVRRVDRAGIIDTYVGYNCGFSCTYNGENLPARKVNIYSGVIFPAFGPDGTLYFYNDQNYQGGRRIMRVYRRGTIASGASTLVPTDDQVFAFDPAGRLLSTRGKLRGNTFGTFAYNSSGVLSSVTDGDGNVTQIDRPSASTLTLTAPHGLVTTVAFDANGYLQTVTNANNEVWTTTHTADGLLTSFRTPNQTADSGLPAHAFQYDAFARLVSDSDGIGTQTLSHTTLPSGWETTFATGEGRTTIHTIDFSVPAGTNRVEHRSHVWPSNATSSEDRYIEERYVATAADGTVTTTQRGPDPRFTMVSGLASTRTIVTPGGITRSETTVKSSTLATGTDPFSVTNETTTRTINGQGWTETFNASASTRTTTSPLGRHVVTTLDAKDRPTQIAVTNIAPITLTYDALGRVSHYSQGSHAFTVNYNATSGFVDSVTNDALAQATSFQRDPVGRPTSKTLPGVGTVALDYDRNGNLASLMPPGKTAHAFRYTPNDLVSAYDPPDNAVLPRDTTYQYNRDRQVTLVNQAGASLSSSYDSAGRLSLFSFPSGSVTRTYDSASRLASLTTADNIITSFGYDGFLTTDINYSGTGFYAHQTHRSFDRFFRVSSQTLDGGNAQSWTFDNDGLLAGAGAMTITRDPYNGLANALTVGALAETVGYADPNAAGFSSGYGEATSYTVKNGSANLYAMQLSRDAGGRITQKIETLGGGAAQTTRYSYDSANRLAQVFLSASGSTPDRTYSYDQNGNRTGFNGSTIAIYDAQDRLLNYDGSSYTYTNSGELASKTTGAATTTFSYDAVGNVRHVTLPSGASIDYVIDGRNHRVGKKVNGALTNAWVYAGGLSPIAELDGGGALKSLFVYGLRRNVPDLMVSGGATYRLVTDQLGSVRLVVNTATGAIAEQIEYDEWGNVLADTNPGFQPFGFAGGLYDRDTNLVRFGARDYDPKTGRWTSKDAARFRGGLNLYVYCHDDPINLVDSTGRNPTAGTMGGLGSGAGAGASSNAGVGPGGALAVFALGARLAWWVMQDLGSDDRGDDFGPTDSAGGPARPGSKPIDDDDAPTLDLGLCESPEFLAACTDACSKQFPFKDPSGPIPNPDQCEPPPPEFAKYLCIISCCNPGVPPAPPAN
jgi:RHS repeat-associated protein